MSDTTPDAFVRLFMAHQRRILAFVLSLQPNLNDAEDIVQEVGKVMWEKFDEFEPDTSFEAWGIQIARYKVLEFRRAQGRAPLFANDQLVQLLADDAEARRNDAAARQDALDACLQSLEPRHQELLTARYSGKQKIKDLAVKLNRSVVTVRKLLAGLHAQLGNCIDKRLAEETQ